jgi:hypothetical protein
MKVTKAKTLEHQLICHSCVATRVRPVHAMLWTSRTRAAISSPLGSLRIASTFIAPMRSEAWTGNVCEANDRIALGALLNRGGAQDFAGARSAFVL